MPPPLLFYVPPISSSPFSLLLHRYGAVGFNVPYEFTESDLRISVRQVAASANAAWARGHMGDLGGAGDDESSEAAANATSTRLQQRRSSTALVGGLRLPWTLLRYTCGECNYGGRVTDEKDRRVLRCLLERCLGPSAVVAGSWLVPPPTKGRRRDNNQHHTRNGDDGGGDESGHGYAGGGGETAAEADAKVLASCARVPRVPSGGWALDDYARHVDKSFSSAEVPPGMFGLPPNAAMRKANEDAEALLRAVVDYEGLVGGGGSGDGGGSDGDDVTIIEQIALQLKIPLPSLASEEGGDGVAVEINAGDCFDLRQAQLVRFLWYWSIGDGRGRVLSVNKWMVGEGEMGSDETNDYGGWFGREL